MLRVSVATCLFLIESDSPVSKGAQFEKCASTIVHFQPEKQ